MGCTHSSPFVVDLSPLLHDHVIFTHPAGLLVQELEDVYANATAPVALAYRERKGHKHKIAPNMEKMQVYEYVVASTGKALFYSKPTLKGVDATSTVDEYRRSSDGALIAVAGLMTGGTMDMLTKDLLGDHGTASAPLLATRPAFVGQQPTQIHDDRTPLFLWGMSKGAEFYPVMPDGTFSSKTCGRQPSDSPFVPGVDAANPAAGCVVPMAHFGSSEDTTLVLARGADPIVVLAAGRSHDYQVNRQ